jgi:multidrug efflux pump subunit AcrB
MDPLSIIGTVGAISQMVYQVSTTLYMFIQAAKNVDQSVKSLYAEIDALYRVLDAISSSLADPMIRSAMAGAQDSSKLWSSFDGSLMDCRQTAQSLDDILKNVKGKSTSRNPFKQSIRQIKLNLNEDDIKNIRSQIQTHNMNLQMALQTINV